MTRRTNKTLNEKRYGICVTKWDSHELSMLGWDCELTISNSANLLINVKRNCRKTSY